MQKELNQVKKSPKKLSIIRIVIALAILFSIVYIVIQIIKYQEIQKVQKQIQRGLSSANLILIAPTSTEKFIFKNYFDYYNDIEFKKTFQDCFKNIVKIDSANDIKNIIDNFIISRHIDREACRCDGSHYLAFYNHKIFLGIIQVKHAEVIVFYNKDDKPQGHYYINKSALNNVIKILKKYKINLKQ